MQLATCIPAFKEDGLLWSIRAMMVLVKGRRGQQMSAAVKFPVILSWWKQDNLWNNGNPGHLHVADGARLQHMQSMWKLPIIFQHYTCPSECTVCLACLVIFCMTMATWVETCCQQKEKLITIQSLYIFVRWLLCNHIRNENSWP
jgi:hypothetical protein